MPRVYSNGEIKETQDSEEQLEKDGLQQIKTMQGVVWASPSDTLKVFRLCGGPPRVPKPQVQLLGGGPPPPPMIGGGPPPPPMIGGGPPPPMGLNPMAPVKNVVKEPPKKETESNKSSAVPKEQMNDFVAGMVKNSDQVGFPVYSVCDNNSFHTSGYLWGYYAALMLKKLNLPAGPIAVVNFDSHQDAGQSSSPVVASDRWGSLLIKAMSDLGFPACYLSAFNRQRGAMVPGTTTAYFGSVPAVKMSELPEETQRAFKLSCVIPQSDAKSDEMMAVIQEQFRTFWSAVQTHFGEPIKYVFFTIDRDVLNDSFTQWGNGTIRGTLQLIQLIEAALTPLNVLRGADAPQAKLIGFDVTGLPESKTYQTEDPRSGYGLPKMVWSKLAHELYSVFDFAHSRLAEVRSSHSSSHMIFFSGSVSYASQSGSEDPETWNCWNYVAHLAGHLKLLLASNNLYFRQGWSYLLCEQAAPIYEAAWKRFTLYTPEQAPQPCKAEELDQVAEKMRPQLGDGTVLGGFSCTAGVSDFSRFDKSKHKVSWDDMVNMRNMFAPPK